MRVSISRKSFIIFFLLTSFTFFLGIIVYTRINAINHLYKDLKVFNDFRLQTVLFRLNHSNIERGQFHLNKERFETDLKKIEQLINKINELEFIKEINFSKKLNLINQSLEYYKIAFKDLFQIHLRNENFGHKNSKDIMNLSKASRGLSTFQKKRLSEITLKIFFFQEKIYHHREVKYIALIRHEIKKIRGISANRNLLIAAELYLRKIEANYLDFLAFKDKNNSLIETSKNFFDFSEKTIITLSDRIQNRIFYLIQVIFFLIFLSLVFTIFLWRWTSKYIKNFLDSQNLAIKSIKSGKFDYEPQPVTEDELGDLSLFMKHLADTLDFTIQEIRKSELKFKDLVENISDWLWVTDHNGKCNYSSPIGKKITGLEYREIINEPIADLIDHEKAYLLKQALEKRESFDSLETRYQTKDGKIIEFSTSGRPVFISGIKFSGFRCISRDITEKKEMEKSLHRKNEELSAAYEEMEASYEETEALNKELISSQDTIHHIQQYLKNMIDSIPSMIIGIDQNCIITQWNLQAEILSVYKGTGAIGKKIQEVLPEFFLNCKELLDTVEMGTVYKKDKVSVVRDNRKYFYNIVAYTLQSKEEQGAVIRIDDISEEVFLKEKVVQSEKMITMGLLAAGLAHEINNPLAGVLQNLYVIKNRLSMDLEKNKQVALESGISLEKVIEYIHNREIMNMLDLARESALRAADIIEGMLGFSRKSGVELEPEDIHKILDSTLALLEKDYDLISKYDFKQIEILREYNSNLPPVACQKSKLQQVFFNILKNGSQAMTVEEKIDQPRFRIKTGITGNSVFIEIEDNGPGMDEETCKHIFEPFFTTKDNKYGTGLGLSISYHIISELHKGTIQLESSPGAGAKFTITLPSM